MERGKVRSPGVFCCALVLITLALSFSRGGRAMADTVAFSQPSDLSGASASQNDTTSPDIGSYATTYDNFVLPGESTITGVAWTGSYFAPPSPGVISGFLVSFYANEGGTPGSLLASFKLTGDASQKFAGEDKTGAPSYSYFADVNVSVPGGTTEWISIVADLSLPPQWGWESSAAGDGVSYQCYFGSCGQIPLDEAFTLTTSTVPEPSGAVLLTTGAAACAVRLRRVGLGCEGDR